MKHIAYCLFETPLGSCGMKDIPRPKQLDALGELWRPHRTVATLYLWNSIKPKGTEKQ